MKKNRKKGLLIALLVVLALAAGAGIGYKVHRIRYCNERVLLVAFDDYNEENWESHFDLFDEYRAKVTFFVNAGEPTDFCFRAIKKGHEIGFHTVGHVDLRESSKEEVYEQAIAPIGVFREKGIELTSFAYPYGHYTEELNAELLAHYETVRGAYFYEVNPKISYHGGFIEAFPMDNGCFESEEAFQEKITALLDEFCDGPQSTAVCMYSHAIGGGEWSISEERLEFLLREAAKRKIKMVTFQDLQKFWRDFQ